MFLRLLLLFTLVPLVELYLLIRIGEIIGIGPTIALVIGTGAVGAVLTRLEGLRVLGRVRSDLAEGRMPTDHLLDGLLILVAGAVLLTPGLLTDGLGFLLLLPPGRRAVRKSLSAALERRIGVNRPTVIDADWTRGDS
jgi:UPF0716 protein FxsA